MWQNFNRQFTRLLLFLLAFLMIFGFADAIEAGNQDTSLNSSVYLPISMKNHPHERIFGSQFVNLGDADISELAADAGIYWARIDAFNWEKIEPQNSSPGNYKWGEVDEASLKAVRENGMHTIAIIRNAPDWALENPSHSCGPIKEEAFADFAEFVREVVKRYSVSPYNIKHWELWNEPDPSPGEVAPGSVFGCWGDISDTDYYGGSYYGEMLKVIYPVIKAADAEAQVLIGGLLLDCDPTHDGGCKSGKFFEGIVKTRIHRPGDTFDYVNFHGYAFATTPTGQGTLSIDEDNAKWGHRGGVVLGKIDFLEEIMGKYGANKPIFHTEASLICHPGNVVYCDPPVNAFYRSQADYVIQLFVRNLAEGIFGTIWYQFEGPGWRHGGLLDETQVPKPAYEALKFLITELGAVEYIGPVEGLPVKVAGYKFGSDVKLIWVLWSEDGKSQPILLPGNFDRILDGDGDEIDFTPDSVSSPIYVEFDN